MNPRRSRFMLYSGVRGEELPAYAEIPRDQSIHLAHGRLFVVDHGVMTLHVFSIRERRN